MHPRTRWTLLRIANEVHGNALSNEEIFDLSKLQKSTFEFRMKILELWQEVEIDDESFCKIVDISVSTLHKYRKDFREFGEDGLRSKQQQYNGGRPLKLTETVKSRIVEIFTTLETPTGQEIADQIVKEGFVDSLDRHVVNKFIKETGLRERESASSSPPL